MTGEPVKEKPSELLRGLIVNKLFLVVVYVILRRDFELVESVFLIAESATKGRNHAVNSLLQLTGKDKDYKVKADVNADVNTETTVNNPGLNKIAEAYLNGRKQHNNESLS